MIISVLLQYSMFTYTTHTQDIQDIPGPCTVHSVVFQWITVLLTAGMHVHLQWITVLLDVRSLVAIGHHMSLIQPGQSKQFSFGKQRHELRAQYKWRSLKN